jgi:Cyclic nucleotide-binding domain
MSGSGFKLDAKLLQQFFPLNRIDPRYHDQIIQNSLLSSIKTGEFIFRKNIDRSYYHFLVDGTIEVRKSFDQRYSLVSGDEKAHLKLEEHHIGGGSIRAMAPCLVLVVNADTIEQLLAWSQSFGYEVVHSNEMELVSPDDRIDDAYETDWAAKFVQSSLASNLKAADLHRLFQSLDPITVYENETIVQRNTPGDFFFVLQSGYAMVHTDPSGPYKGAQIELVPGDYFGDEALVAETMRNANVVMATNGVVGRLSRDAFDTIIRQAVIRHREFGGQHQYDDRCHIIDVRFPFEYKLNPTPRAENIPISHLRKQLASFDVSKVYIITSNGGRRSELAAYLLRQAGFEAYCMEADDASAMDPSAARRTA